MTQEPLPHGTLTVAQVIELLQREDPDTPCMFSYDYGDRSSTEVVAPVKVVEPHMVTHSNYHRSFKISRDWGEEDHEVVVLSAYYA